MVETIQQLNGQSMAAGLNDRGYTVINSLLDDGECRSLIGLYDEDARFRKRVVMQSHGYGKGEYRYLSYPLPDLIQNIRTDIYPKLVPIANAWHEAMKMDVRFPQNHAEFLERCHKAGQVKPTPLILKYEASDYNCLHQDLYGEHVFPLQLAILLSAPGDDFSGGEFVLTEQRPRMQSRVHVVPLKRGDAVVFAVNNRPVAGTRGNYKVVMRHGVSEIRNGKRFTAGIIFHDAG
ncbi:MAG: 2OG-Fe(II) oxygenase [Cyanobacteria bacterium SZAS LIN-3]|nr:2OG-Fe(II) oxygenase [Cyanobacteria bacterium SZAS LIN-3]